MRMHLSILAIVCSLCSTLHGQQWGVRLDGTPLQELAPGDARAVVLFFVATDCPISNRMFPEMRRLREEFETRGIRFLFVYPNTYEKRLNIEAHQKEFDTGGGAIVDRAGALVRLSHAIATPQMAIFTPGNDHWKRRYSGPIDNQYIRIGLQRPAATQHFGEDALVAVLAGKPVRQPTLRPVGCAIMNPGVQ